MFCDVVCVLVMLLSGLRDGGAVCLRFRVAGFGFNAAAAFFCSFCSFLSAFSFSSLAFFSALALISLIDCSSVNIRENVVDMPLRRRDTGGGATRSGGGLKIDVIDCGAGRGEERRGAGAGEESNTRVGAWGTDGET